MVKTSKYIAACFCIAIATVVLGFFLLGVEQIAIHFWALAFLLLSLLISAASLISVAQKKSPEDTMLFKSGIGVVTCLYQVAVIVSIIFVGAFNEAINKFIFTEILITAAYAIVFLAVSFFANRNHVAKVDSQEYQDNNQNNTPKRGGY